MQKFRWEFVFKRHNQQPEATKRRQCFHRKKAGFNIMMRVASRGFAFMKGPPMIEHDHLIICQKMLLWF